MSDEWVKEAERRGDEQAEYGEWINNHENDLIEAWAEKLEIDDVPDYFIQSQYESAMEKE